MADGFEKFQQAGEAVFDWDVFLKLVVYDVFGRDVATLVDGKQSAGTHKAEFDASRLTSGFYLYTLRAGSFVATKEMLLIQEGQITPAPDLAPLRLGGESLKRMPQRCG